MGSPEKKKLYGVYHTISKLLNKSTVPKISYTYKEKNWWTVILFNIRDMAKTVMSSENKLLLITGTSLLKTK